MGFSFDGTEKHSWIHRTNVNPMTGMFAVYAGN